MNNEELEVDAAPVIAVPVAGPDSPEQAAIQRIRDHINSGKFFVLTNLGSGRFEVPSSWDHFFWSGGPGGRWLRVEQPLTLIREISFEEAVANWLDGVAPPRPDATYYEVVID